ncbi:unnamed protein product [Adineta ricciae]|uniref:PiggyBac transposable element-derived protein domain-containing protein n=1 Tax=Adineta ricciae TaxID=249248 RepID=A0A815UNW9_ADIRI|nr:unnamed protein product [Adineta ricciae]
MEIDEIFNDSGSELATEFDDLHMSSTNEEDEEMDIASPTIRKKHAPRKWRQYGFDLKDLKFSDRASGVNEEFEIEGNNPSDYFKAFFDDELMEIIVEETNNYQQQNTTPNIAKTAAWYDTNAEEMYIFFATTILMGLNQKNRIKDYWSTDKLITTPIFGELFTRNRYLSVLRYLHFADNNTEQEGKLREIQHIIENLRKKSQKAQYIPSKKHHFGVKLFLLCDCETKFVLNFIIYTGAETEIDNYPEVGISSSVVLTLMKNYLKKNHTLFIDNWYSSPTLFERLLEEKTKACGTVKRTRNGMPMFGKLAKGQQEYRTTGELLALKWMDEREVYMLTTAHKPVMVETGKNDKETGRKIKKPHCIVQYNKNMGAVDQVDMQTSFSECLRKTIKWYKKLFFHLFDVTVQNSYAMYKMKTHKNIELSQFRLELARELIEEYGSMRPQTKGRPPIDCPLRLSARHFIAFIPAEPRLSTTPPTTTVTRSPPVLGPPPSPPSPPLPPALPVPPPPPPDHQHCNG